MTVEKLTISVSEAAKILGIGRGHAYELARCGQLPGVIRLGAGFKVTKSVLMEHLENKEKES